MQEDKKPALGGKWTIGRILAPVISLLLLFGFITIGLLSSEDNTDKKNSQSKISQRQNEVLYYVNKIDKLVWGNYFIAIKDLGEYVKLNEEIREMDIKERMSEETREKIVQALTRIKSSAENLKIALSALNTVNTRNDEINQLNLYLENSIERGIEFAEVEYHRMTYIRCFNSIDTDNIDVEEVDKCKPSEELLSKFHSNDANFTIMREQRNKYFSETFLYVGKIFCIECMGIVTGWGEQLQDYQEKLKEELETESEENSMK